MNIPYTPQSMWVWSPHGHMVTGVSSRYAFELRVPRGTGATTAPPLWRSGDPVVSIRRDARPVAVSRDERGDQRAWVDAMLNARQGNLDGPVPAVPEVKPAYRRLLAASDGRIWVSVSTRSERYEPPPPGPSTLPGVSQGVGGGAGGGAPSIPRVTPAPWREPVIFDVFEADGRYVGQVGVPWDTRVLSMRGDTVWGVITNQDEVPIVHRLRVTWR
jgi:hypothetical protein